MIEKTYMTPRQVIATGLISERTLRDMIHNGECPGYVYGKGGWFKVNYPMLVEKLEEMSRRSMGK